MVFNEKLILSIASWIVIESIILTCSSNAIPEELDHKKRHHYIAAVVEYQSEGPSSTNISNPVEILNFNTAAYKDIISKAANQGAEIIVFPEYGLTSLEIPSHRELARPYLLEVPMGTNPCSSGRHDSNLRGVLYELSCSAMEHKMYIVVNLGEIEYCSAAINDSCPQDGAFQYNTNIVFDNKGTIISRYRKIHLYFEPQFNHPDPELSTFTTDFGVEFGMFTCFDIIFETPGVDLVKNGIKNFVFPTAWVDELPFLTAIQSQASWAFGANSNLLSSGYHRPQNGQLGSGIYSGVAGAINYTFNPDSGTQIILAEIPIEPWQSNIETARDTRERKTSHYYLKEDLTNYTTKVLEHSLSKTNEVICQDGFCCQLNYAMDNSSLDDSGVYRLAVLNGSRSVAVTDRFSTQICSVIRCFDGSLLSCSFNYRGGASLPTFTSFSLKASPFISNNLVMRPTLNTIDVALTVIPYHLFNISIDTLSSMEITSNRISMINLQTIALTKIIYYSRRL